MGTTRGAAIDIWPDHVTLTALFPPDDLPLAERNGTLFLLTLCALRPQWVTAPDWLKTQMGMAAKARAIHESQHFGRRVLFRWEKATSRATLRVGV